MIIGSGGPGGPGGSGGSDSGRWSNRSDLPDLPGLPDLPDLPGHRSVNLIEQRHRRQTARRARFGLAALADRARELDVLSIERGGAVEWYLFAVAVGHRIAIHHIGLLLADVTIEAAEGPLIVERHRHREQGAL